MPDAFGSADQQCEALWQAVGDRNWPRAADLAARLRVSFPEVPDGHLFGIVAAREEEELETALQLGTEAAALFPATPQIRNEYGLIYFVRRDWGQACAHFVEMIRDYPHYLDGYQRASSAYQELGSGLEALAVLKEAANVFPHNAAVLRQAASFAETVHAWDDGAGLWKKLSTFDASADAIEGQSRCLLHAGRHDEISHVERPAAQSVVPARAQQAVDSAASVASRFQSLGGGSDRDDLWGYGCEFGYYQRSLGLEPLHFLRWASVPPLALIHGLRDQFAEISDSSKISFLENEDPIWNMVHQSYDIRIDHTGIFKKDHGEVEAKRRIVTHMSYLRDKFLEDLEDGDKAFVYRTFDHTMPNEQLQSMSQAIRAYGRGQILYVRLFDESHQTIEVERVSDNLLIGYIDFFAPQPNNVLRDNLDGWTRICRLAADLI